MTIDKETIKRHAYLNRMAVTDEEAERLKAELEGVIEELSEFAALNLGSVEPMYAFAEDCGKHALRADIVDDGGIADRVTELAPEREGTFFVVPKILD